jgi:hypothetical protein
MYKIFSTPRRYLPMSMSTQHLPYQHYTASTHSWTPTFTFTPPSPLSSWFRPCEMVSLENGENAWAPKLPCESECESFASVWDECIEALEADEEAKLRFDEALYQMVSEHLHRALLATRTMMIDVLHVLIGFRICRVVICSTPSFCGGDSAFSTAPVQCHWWCVKRHRP